MGDLSISAVANDRKRRTYGTFCAARGTLSTDAVLNSAPKVRRSRRLRLRYWCSGDPVPNAQGPWGLLEPHHVQRPRHAESRTLLVGRSDTSLTESRPKVLQQTRFRLRVLPTGGGSSVIPRQRTPDAPPFACHLDSDGRAKGMWILGSKITSTSDGICGSRLSLDQDNGFCSHPGSMRSCRPVNFAHWIRSARLASSAPMPLWPFATTSFLRPGAGLAV
jgi:hypothetical protein